MRPSTAIILFHVLYLPVMAKFTPQESAIAFLSTAEYVFVCDDNDLATLCRNPPYNFNCTLEGFLNADLPLGRCRDETKCSCELQSTVLRT